MLAYMFHAPITATGVSADMNRLAFDEEHSALSSEVAGFLLHHTLIVVYYEALSQKNSEMRSVDPDSPRQSEALGPFAAVLRLFSWRIMNTGCILSQQNCFKTITS